LPPPLLWWTALQGLREAGVMAKAGYGELADPGVLLVEKLYCYAKRYRPQSRIMASGLRTKEGEGAVLPSGNARVIVASGLGTRIEGESTQRTQLILGAPGSGADSHHTHPPPPTHTLSLSRTHHTSANARPHSSPHSPRCPAPLQRWCS
jgi:hypothetical protein